jgi:hypothetical protein
MLWPLLLSLIGVWRRTIGASRISAPVRRRCRGSARRGSNGLLMSSSCPFVRDRTQQRPRHRPDRRPARGRVGAPRAAWLQHNTSLRGPYGLAGDRSGRGPRGPRRPRDGQRPGKRSFRSAWPRGSVARERRPQGPGDGARRRGCSPAPAPATVLQRVTPANPPQCDNCHSG